MKKILMAIMLSATAVFAGGDVVPVEAPIEVIVVDETKDFYVGVGVTAVQTYVNGQSDWFSDGIDAETGYGLGLNVGYVVYRADAFEVAVEGRANRTFWNYFTDADDAELTTYSALIKPQYNFGGFGVYGLAGYGASKFTAGSFSIRENGFVYGGGAEYAINDTYGLTLDYVVNPAFKSATDIENDVITFGVNYKF